MPFQGTLPSENATVLGGFWWTLYTNIEHFTPVLNDDSVRGNIILTQAVEKNWLMLSWPPVYFWICVEIMSLVIASETNWWLLSRIVRLSRGYLTTLWAGEEALCVRVPLRSKLLQQQREAIFQSNHPACLSSPLGRSFYIISGFFPSRLASPRLSAFIIPRRTTTTLTWRAHPRVKSLTRTS